MLKKFLKTGHIAIICFLSICFQSCFSNFGLDVNIKTHFKENGAGSYSMTVDFDKSKGHGLYIYKDREKEVYDYFVKIFSSAKNKLKSKYLNNNITFTQDDKKQKFKIAFDFGSIATLNAMLKIIFDRQIFFYQYKDGKFVLTTQLKSLKNCKVEDFHKNDNTYIKWFSIKSMLSQVIINRDYSFEKNIKRINDKRIKVLEDKKTAKIRSSVWDFTNPKAIDKKSYFIIAFK